MNVFSEIKIFIFALTTTPVINTRACPYLPPN